MASSISVVENKFYPYLLTALKAALKAGEAIRKVYFSDQLLVEYKQDLSPITLADQHAHECIEKVLLHEKLPILSEEGVHTSFDIRKNWKLFWLVDPLDGTREFVKRNDDFTVNIALVEQNEPKIGVIYSPINGLLYYGIEGMGAFKRDNCFDKEIEKEKLKDFISSSLVLPLQMPREKFTVTVSKSHMNEKTIDFVNQMTQKFDEVETISIGSSLKICFIAEGRADVYPRFGRTMEWDTAAGHAIALAAGCSFTLMDGETSLRYNKSDLTNPNFIVKHKSIVL